MVWLVGCNGMLGRQVSDCLKKAGIPLYETDREVDIASPDDLDKFAADKDIKWIINGAAYTAVDKAESEKEAARNINVLGVGNLAVIAEKQRAMATLGFKICNWEENLDKFFWEWKENECHEK